MKLGNFIVPLPVYKIESDITYHSERKPTVFERTVLRLSDPGFAFPDKQNVSLLSIFRDQLGSGDVRELLERCVSELVALGALPKYSGQEALKVPMSDLKLSEAGLQFLRNDRLPVRSRTIKVWHLYDPIKGDCKTVKNDSKLPNQNNMDRVTYADSALRPKNLLSEVENAVTLETSDWKNANTVIDHILPVLQSAGWEGRRLEISCSEDGVLSVSAPQDLALQRWLEQAQSELSWNILLADALASDRNISSPEIDYAVFRNARSASLIGSAESTSGKIQFCIIAEGASISGAALPTVILSSEVREPKLVSQVNQQIKLYVPKPKELMDGFQSLSLRQDSGVNFQAKVSGNFRLYWAGQPRICGLVVTLNDQETKDLWIKLSQHLEDACLDSNDPRIAFMPMSWRDTAAISEILWPWLAVRSRQSLTSLLALAEEAQKAIGLWRPKEGEWKSVWEVTLARALTESLNHTPNELSLEQVIFLLKQLKGFLSPNNAEPLQSLLLRKVIPIDTVEQLKHLREALPTTLDIPRELFAIELRQRLLALVLARKELKLYGPHTIQQPLLRIENAVQAVYRDIGEQALKAASNGEIDVRSLTPRALDSVHIWRATVDDYLSLNTQSSQWDSLNKELEVWVLLAQSNLAPVEAGYRFVVLDTSALMDRAVLLRELRSNDIPVLPRRVLSELDGLKTSEDESCAVKARAAIRQLDVASSSIRHESEYTSLLPAEWDGNQPDHTILSVALFYRLNEVLFVSNDINLRNKAKAIGVNSQDTKAFRPSAFVPLASSMSTQKQNKIKKQRK